MNSSSINYSLLENFSEKVNNNINTTTLKTEMDSKREIIEHQKIADTFASEKIKTINNFKSLQIY